ncbi:NAD(P)/FAD-dependent oxidoreductase [Aliiglaciecola sp. 3_MG-2023]|uniref:NAD(P)/FAD-dependent oxidoreductase n=1 Tax=Aliiglaciecola sp. 3_MG-2023 TaxID=3062644 RepID=UPI0026E41CDA|nr:NAD(P)/FAD-dependent oxidoreductase [Aliiglaciecola sp. 3_MG-2023]MDO6693040.1 NAD(P)/FAD-dependent oxidoreductase [Aliiglaciecola sp. 3_MG-2023]
MIESVECIVVGAGVVGLAVARQMAQKGVETIVIESQSQIGTGISSRNSEVIHGGIYYPPNSLKARLCVQGNKMLYAYCDERNINHKRCGKLIVATSESQLQKLTEIKNNAVANSVLDLEFYSKQKVLTLEPELACYGALFSPSTGIIDSHGLMLNLQGDLESAGGAVALGAELRSVDCTKSAFLLDIGGTQNIKVNTKYLINCAGLHAQHIAKRFHGLPQNSVPQIHYAKGNYYALSGKAPFSHLIYPIPESAGLGVHSTLDLGNSVRFGPDVEWVNELDYSVDPSRADAFYHQIRKYWPNLKDDSLEPSYAGIRPKLHAKGEEAKDFMIQTESEHGIAGLINLYGIESPGLTASMAIGAMVVEKLLAKKR